MTLILIGSRALKLRNASLIKRPCVDFDFVATKDAAESWIAKNSSKLNISKRIDDENKIILEGSLPIEFEIIKENRSSHLLQQLVLNDSETLETPFGLVPSLNLLFTIKSSHKFKKFEYDARAFWKTAVDYHSMKNAGATIPSEYTAFHKLREKESYNFKTPSLNQDKKSFFNENDGFYKYDHDSIHRAVALQEKPAYTYFAKDGQEALSDKKKFFEVSEQIRMNAVIEEANTLAVERSLVPCPGALTNEQAYAFALAKICSSITSGWFRSWAYSNIFEALKQYPQNYYERFLEAQRNGKILPFKTEIE